MSTRFLTNAAIALLGGLVVVLSLGLASTNAIAWCAFGIAIGVVALSAVVQLDGQRGIAQRLLDAGTGALGGTLIGVSIVFGGTTVMWLVFALALGLVGVAFVGLTLHEIESWRFTHDLGRLHWLTPETPRREVGPRAA